MIAQGIKGWSTCRTPVDQFSWLEDFIDVFLQGQESYAEGLASQGDAYAEIGREAVEKCAGLFAACPQYVADAIVFITCYTDPAVQGYAAIIAGGTPVGTEAIAALGCAAVAVAFHNGGPTVP
jgi:hypothetical protein